MLCASYAPAIRSRHWASWQHYGVQPDLSTYAKSMGSGLPIAAVLGRAEIMDAAHPGGLGGTYSGNPLACAAALEAIDTITKPEFLARAREVGAQIRERLEKLAGRFPATVGEVRGLGPMLAMEIVKEGDPHKPCMETTAAITNETLSRGVITIRAGLYSNCVRFLPPLDISDADLREAMDVVEELAASIRFFME